MLRLGLGVLWLARVCTVVDRLGMGLCWEFAVGLGSVLLLIYILRKLLGVRPRNILLLVILRFQLDVPVVASFLLLLVVHSEGVAIVHQGGNEQEPVNAMNVSTCTSHRTQGETTTFLEHSIPQRRSSLPGQHG